MNDDPPKRKRYDGKRPPRGLGHGGEAKGPGWGGEAKGMVERPPQPYTAEDGKAAAEAWVASLKDRDAVADRALFRKIKNQARYDAYMALIGRMLCEETQDMARIAAATTLLNRIDGMPTQSIKHRVINSVEDLTPEELEALAYGPGKVADSGE